MELGARNEQNEFERDVEASRFAAKRLALTDIAPLIPCPHNHHVGIKRVMLLLIAGTMMIYA
jgi:hypothetical protein